MKLGLDSVPVVVTGGARGVGAAVCRLLGREGAHVVVTDVDIAAARAVAEQIRAEGGDAMAIALDTADEASVESALAAASDWRGPILGACLNAGIGATGDVHDTSLDDWRRLMSVNLDGAFLMMRHLLPVMQRAGRGSIVTTGSVAAFKTGHPTSGPAYGVSKAGLVQLTRHAAVRYSAAGIRVNCVCPGAVDTEFGGRRIVGSSDLEPAPIIAPAGRRASAEEIADPIAFLLSERASFITGHALVVDGGLLLT